MKIVVCLKQVPKLDAVRFDQRNRIVREDVELIVNPVDLRALAHALRLREQVDGEVVALTMGPPSAREVLDDALSRGADRAIHLADKRFAGADTLATARAISQALEREGPDLVLFGRSTLDGATAQVGPQVAELLGLPQVTHATAIEPVDEDRLQVERETERGSEVWTSAKPLAITVDRGPEPPDPGDARGGEVAEIDAEDLGGTPRDYGTRGSPTFVQEVRSVSLDRDGERAEGLEEGAKRLLELLDSAREEPHAFERASQPACASRAIWVIAQRDGDGLHQGSFEGLACARSAAADLAAEVVAVLFCADPGDLPAKLTARGADRALVIRGDSLAEYSTGAVTDALCEAIEELEPFAVIGPWTSEGRDYLPRVAARLGLGLTGDFTRLEVAEADGDDDDPDLMWIKPAWAGTVEAPIITHRPPAMGTLRPGVFQPLEEASRDDAPVDEREVEVVSTDDPARAERKHEVEAYRLLDNAPVVVLVGAGLDHDGVELAQRLADAADAGLGATSRAIGAGVLPRQLEVDVLTRSMSPHLLIALGIDDEADLDAVRGARRLVSVHPDPDAAAHGRADLAITAEPAELARALLERIDER